MLSTKCAQKILTEKRTSERMSLESLSPPQSALPSLLATPTGDPARPDNAGGVRRKDREGKGQEKAGQHPDGSLKLRVRALPVEALLEKWSDSPERPGWLHVSCRARATLLPAATRGLGCADQERLPRPRTRGAGGCRNPARPKGQRPRPPLHPAAPRSTPYPHTQPLRRRGN